MIVEELEGAWESVKAEARAKASDFWADNWLLICGTVHLLRNLYTIERSKDRGQLKVRLTYMSPEQVVPCVILPVAAGVMVVVKVMSL